jgi:predicted DNA-binding transcriptional regulator AlpA
MQSDGGKKDTRRMLTIEQVLEIVPVARRTIYRMEKEGRFPKGTFISVNRKAWFADEIAEWQDTLPNGRPPRKPHRRRKR